MALIFFISHSHKDEDITRPLVRFLVESIGVEKREIRCTSLMTNGLNVGAKVADQLRADIKGASYFMPLITSNSVRSEYVSFEIGAAWALDKPVVPLIFDPDKSVVIPGLLTGIIRRDLTKQEQLIGLAEELAKEICVARDQPKPTEMYAAAVEFLKDTNAADAMRWSRVRFALLDQRYSWRSMAKLIEVAGGEKTTAEELVRSREDLEYKAENGTEYVRFRGRA